MALDDAYFTTEEYRAYAGNLEAAPAFLYQQALAVTRYLEARLGMTFNKTDEAVARRINPSAAGPSLSVLPIASTDDLEIVVDQYRTGSFTGLTPIDAAQYQLVYKAGDSYDYEPELRGYPYNAIFIPSWSTAYWWSPTAPVQVTAVWGWPAVPPGVKVDAMELLRLLRLESAFARSTYNQDIGLFVNPNATARSLVASLSMRYSPTGGVVIA